MKPVDRNDRLWQVDLLLTSDNDSDFRALTEFMCEETFSDLKGWQRLGSLLISLGHLNKAKQVCEVLLHQSPTESGQAGIYHMIGRVKYHQGEYSDTITFYEKSMNIEQKFLSLTNPHWAASYSNIGVACRKMGDFSKAFSFCEPVVDIGQSSLPAHHPGIQVCNRNLEVVKKKFK